MFNNFVLYLSKQTLKHTVMDEITLITQKRGNNIHVINKGAKYEIGIVHCCGTKFKNQYEDREYSYLNNAVQSLLKHKTIL